MNYIEKIDCSWEHLRACDWISKFVEIEGGSSVDKQESDIC